MITIVRHFGKFKVKFSEPGMGVRGLSVLANDLFEVHTALDHHHGRPHRVNECGLCRLAEKENARARLQDSCRQG